MSRQIEIPQVQIEGRITLGEEPLAATVWFDGRSSFAGSPRGRLLSSRRLDRTALQVGGGQAKTDAAGRFSITMAAGIERVVAHVAALGYGYKSMWVNLADGPLHLRVEEGAGVIEIAEPVEQDALMALGLQIGIFREGLPVHTTLSGFSNSPAIQPPAAESGASR